MYVCMYVCMYLHIYETNIMYIYAYISSVGLTGTIVQPAHGKGDMYYVYSIHIHIHIHMYLYLSALE